MAKSFTVLIADDETPIRRFLRRNLGALSYRVLDVGDGASAMRAVEQETPDLLIIDLDLSGMSASDVIRAVRARSMLPIIVLSTRHDERWKVETLDLSASDYVTKPFGMEELAARIRAALRHCFHARGEIPLFLSGDLAIDLVRRIVTRSNAEVHLSPKQYALLAELVANANKLLTHRHLLEKVWGPAHTEDRPYLRVAIRSLRHKLEVDPTRPAHILTEAGVGYLMRRGGQCTPGTGFWEEQRLAATQTRLRQHG